MKHKWPNKSVFKLLGLGKIREWIYRNFADVFSFYLNIFFIRIEIRLFTKAAYCQCYYILWVSLRLFGKRIVEVEWGETTRHRETRRMEVVNGVFKT